MAKLKFGQEEVCLDQQLFKVANLFMVLFGAEKTTHCYMLVTRISLLFLLSQEANKSNGKLTTELFLESTGIQAITLLSHAEKIANIEFGINMEDNYIAHLLTITLSQVLSGLLMVIISLLVALRCSDCAINQDGHILSINQQQDLF